MDFIELERIEPFERANANSQPIAPEQANANSQLAAFDNITVFNTPTAFNQPSVLKKPSMFKSNAEASKPFIYNGAAYQYQHGEVNGSFQKLRTKTCEPQPIPPQVIPLMAFIEQVQEYEAKFLNDGNVVDRLTMKALMQPFSHYDDPTAGKNPKYAKIIFLFRLFQRISTHNMNYDAAVVCCDRQSEQLVYKALDSAGLNVRTMTSMFKKNVFGVMVKIRKDITDRRYYRPITRNVVDAVFVHDSACGINVENVWSLLKGVRFDHPTLFYLACMDTAEIRIHTYNRSLHNTKIPIRWDTKVSDLDHDLQQMLLLQPNRLPEYIATIAWNDHLSQIVFNWIADKKNILYEYRFPNKGGLCNEVSTFLLHHPAEPSTLPALYTDVKAILANLPPPITRDTRPPAAAKAAKDVRPRVRSSSNSGSNIRPDDTVVSVGKSVVPSIRPLSSSSSALRPVTTTTTLPAGNTPSHRSPPGVATPSRAVSSNPPAAPAGIHPERMAMIEGNVSLPSTSGVGTNERKRGREEEDINMNVKKGKMPTNANMTPIMKDTQSSNDTVMEDAQGSTTFDSAMKEIGVALNTDTDDATSSSSKADEPKDSTSLATDFAESFNAFFKDALQKFEDEISNIKF